MRSRARRARLALALAALLAGALAGCQALPGGFPGSEEWVAFEGNRSLERGELLRVIVGSLEDFERTGLAKPAVDDAAFLLEQHYRDEGYAFADVTYELTLDPPHVLFAIEEGPRVRLDGIALEGVASLLAKEVREIVDARLRPDGGRSPYAEGALQSATRQIERYYYERGFLDARVTGRTTRLDREQATADVEIRVEEGPRSRLQSVHWSGELAIGRAQLDALAAPLIERPYTPRTGVRLSEQVEELLRDGGHPDATVELIEIARTETGAVSVALSLSPGEKVTVTGVRVEGIEKTREETVSSRVALEAGDTYSAKAVRESFERLYAMGVFREIRIHLEPETGPERELVVEVAELPSVELFLEPGLGSYELARFTAGVRNRNVAGTGLVLRSEGSISTKAAGIELGLTNPRFRGSEYAADTGLSYERREEPSFEFEETGFDLGLSRRWRNGLSGRLGYSFRHSNLVQTDVNVPVPTEPDFNVSSIELSPIYDTRDGFLTPTRGQRSQATLEFATAALGSEIDFLRGTVSHARYHPLGRRWTLAAHAAAGVIAPLGGTDAIPLQERFFNGGENSVRSFKESELGPIDADGDPVGGEAFSLLSLELRRGLVGSLEGALFWDAGNVTLDHSDFWDFADVRQGIGVGLRYMLPVGPLRIDAGFNPDVRPGEDEWVVHFAIGRAY